MRALHRFAAVVVLEVRIAPCTFYQVEINFWLSLGELALITEEWNVVIGKEG